MTINGYMLKGELNNANSGFSKWGFAVKDGKEYFVKELISPVYPVDPGCMTEEMYAGRIQFCRDFEARCQRLYTAINDASRGNLVRIIEFFRWGSKYYIITEKVENRGLSPEVISNFSNEKKYLLLKSIAHCFMCLHNAGVVHMDVKPNNFMIKQTNSGNCVARLIDFDGGLLADEIDKLDEELGGDLTYLSPEVFLNLIGEDVRIGTKTDIFSLGLVFHEYFCGKLPDYDKSEYDYIYELALENGGIEPDRDKMPEKMANLIESMLKADPDERPDSSTVMRALIEIANMQEAESVKKDGSTYVDGEEWFMRAGDL